MAKKQSQSTQQSTAATPAPEQHTAPVTAAPAQVAASEKKTRAPSKKAEAPAQQAAPATPSPVPTQAVASEKKTRAPSKKAEAPAQQAAPATPAPVAVSSSSEQSSEEQSQSVEALFQTLVLQAEQLMETQKTWLATLRRAVKCYTRESRETARANARLAAKRARRQGGDAQKRAPSGFQIPTNISDNLCDFLGVAHGTKMSRNVVTKQINNYIREQNLQVQENRRSFVPDTKLGAILGKLQEVDASSGFTYFNLQRYISRHFTPNSASTTVASSAN
jgi:chromatin remodeling complex protein RSC6